MSLSHVFSGLISSIRTCLKMGLNTLPVFILLHLVDLISAQNNVLASSTTAPLAPLAPTDLLTTPIPGEPNCTRDATPCKDGILLKMWSPQPTPETPIGAGDKASRAIVYMVCMIYMFLGVSIVADRFMASIEVITSKEKEIVVKRPDGETQVVNVRIWNETVSNLTLMALGSSAPEILLSVIEICGNKFEAGALGPSTIVGSAAFNLFVIIAICVYCIPDGEVRRIKHLRVFFITATWSIFAYLWLFFIVAVSSPGKVRVWEAVLTLFYFPLTVLTAYIADQKLLMYKFLSKKYTASTHKGGVMVASEGLHETEMHDGKTSQMTEEMVYKGIDSNDANVREFEQHRRDFIEIMRELRQKNPDIDMKTLEEMAEYEAVNRGPKSRAFYRIQATRKLTGGGKVIKKAKIERRASVTDVKVDEEEVNPITQIYFDPGHYTVMENVGSFSVTVSREGGDLEKTCYVDYTTADGTASAGTDFLESSGTLCFQPHEHHKQFNVTILDDDVFEEDEHFYVQLSNVRIGDSSGMFTSDENSVVLAQPFMATVMILDDDHPGIFHFDVKDMTITENIGEVMVKVCRASGARGTVKVPYHALDGSAKAGKDFDIVTGEIFFENDEAEQFIKIRIVDDEEYEKTESFQLVLEQPVCVMKSDSGSHSGSETGSQKDGSGSRRGSNEKSLVKSAGRSMVPCPEDPDEKIAEMGRPRLGDSIEITINIKESMEFKSTVDKLLKKANVSLVVGTSSWREQFIEAITVSAGDDDDDDEEGEESEEKLPSCMDYVMHFLTLFWKLLFAFVPPTDYFGGWACFVVSIALVGLLTAVIGDLASGFGCTVGLKDSVTAISFVALGTSVPDTFASKVAAINDRYADSSIGNVTGSNAVNVFLGIGIAWTIAAVYHAINGTEFIVPIGDIATSVTVFCVMAVCAVMILLVRRRPEVGGELGGPVKYKYATSAVLFCFWLLYILISSFSSYCYIDPL